MASKILTDQDLDEIYAFAVQLGKDAGKLLLDAARARFGGNGRSTQEYVEKDSSVDIVTKTDEGTWSGAAATAAPLTHHTILAN